MLSIFALAAIGGAAATAATIVATGDALMAANTIQASVHLLPPGLDVALSHVPTASHAYAVLKEHLSLYAGVGSAGAVGTGGVADVTRQGIHFGHE